MKVTALMTCNKFWNRFRACAPHWKEAAFHGEQQWLDIKVAYPRFRPPSNQLPHDVFEYKLISDAYLPGSLVESKPMMLKRMIDEMRRDPPTYVVFTDADIIPPPDLFDGVTNKTTLFWTASRVDLSQVMTESFLRSGNLPSNEVLRSHPTEEKKIGMGWFQMVRWEALNAVYPSLPWHTSGYDKFDYALWQELNNRFGSRQLYTKRPFVHLWHGDPGSTWQGTDKEW